MLKHWFRIVRTAVTAVGVFFAFFAFVEVVRAYQTLRGLHPAAGYAFLAVITAAVAWLVWYLWVNLAAVPRALKPPVIPDPAQATDRQLRKYLRYLRRFLERLTVNDCVSEANQANIQIALNQIDRAMAEAAPAEMLRATIEVVEARAIVPALDDIDALAARQVRDSMRDIMIGVTLSPYKSPIWPSSSTAIS